MIQTADAIILRVQEVRRTSVIITFMTEEFGKIKGIMRGVRGPHAESGYQAQLFTNNRIVFYERKRGNLFTVSQCDLTDFFHGIRADLNKMAFAAYFVELTDCFTEFNSECRGVYALLNDSLNALEGDASPRRLSRLLEIRLLGISGLMPGFENCSICRRETGIGGGGDGRVFFDISSGGALCGDCRKGAQHPRELLPGTVQFIQHVGKAPYEMALRVKVSEQVGKELEGLMKDFVAYHIGRSIKSAEFLKKLVNRHCDPPKADSSQRRL